MHGGAALERLAALTELDERPVPDVGPGGQAIVDPGGHGDAGELGECGVAHNQTDVVEVVASAGGVVQSVR